MSRLSTDKLYVGNGARSTHSYTGRLISNRTWTIKQRHISDLIAYGL